MNSNNFSKINTQCAICGISDESREIYPEKLGEEEVDKKSFSARRFYDKKIHFRFVRCSRCGLMRSDPMIDEGRLAQLYKDSLLTYDKEILNLRKTYGHYLACLDDLLPAKENLLEIGCGNGFFLEEALARGFKNVHGVEPSEEAVRKASLAVRPGIKIAMFDKKLYQENFFDIIVIFQTLDHLSNPLGVLSDCRALLKPGGVLLAINHNSLSWSARLLGERSPIIDVEHTYLFDPKTMAIIFEKAGLRPARSFTVKSWCSLGYLLSLAPIRPVWIKTILTKLFRIAHIADFSIPLPIGNLGLAGRKSLVSKKI